MVTRLDFRGVAGAQHLEDGIVLGVDRDDGAPDSHERVAEHRARRHHAFLVGQRDRDAALDRGQRRLDARPRP